MRRIEQMDASDDVKSYLRKVSKESYSIFRNGFIGGGGNNVASLSTHAITPTPTPLSFVPRRLPIKKKRRSSSDDEDEAPPRISNRDHEVPLAHVAAVTTPQPPPRVNLAAKWLAMASFSSLALPLAALPPFEFVEETVQRFTAVRERIGQTRMGIELLQVATTSSFTQRDSWRDRARAIQHVFGLRSASISKEAAESLLSEQEAQLSSCGVPSLTEHAELRKWHKFLEGPSGPFAFGAPTISLMSQLDHAHANTLLHTVITKLQRGMRNQLPPQTSQRRCDDEYFSDMDEVTAGSTEDPSCSHAPATSAGMLFVNDDDNEDDDHATILDINGCEQQFSSNVKDDRTRELLRFLRFLMPCGSADNGAPRSRGLGVWWYSAAASVDLLFDPDTDRALHELFRNVCQHINTLCDVLHGPEGNKFPTDKRGAMLEYLNQPRHRANDVHVKNYWDVADVDQHDLLAMYTLLVILAKVFHQNQNNLLNL